MTFSSCLGWVKFYTIPMSYQSVPSTIACEVALVQSAMDPAPTPQR